MIILSKLADYGVIVATHLAAYPDRQVTAGTVATETRLPQATVAKVLKALAHAGLVAATRGAGGGYRLARLATSISVAEVVAAIDGDIGMTLGRILTQELTPGADVIALDGIQLKEFDYIDIGELIQPTDVVPVIIKSLLF